MLMIGRVFFGARFAIHARENACTWCAETGRAKAKARAARSTAQTASDRAGGRGSGAGGGEPEGNCEEIFLHLRCGTPWGLIINACS